MFLIKSNFPSFANSAYYPVFRSMLRNVVAALNEAQDITLYLKPLAGHFTQLELSDFPDIVPQLRPLMHCVCVVYSTSGTYIGTNFFL